MKKLIAVGLAAALVAVAAFGAGMALAGSNTSNGSNGVPAQKTTLTSSNVTWAEFSDNDSNPNLSDWITDHDLENIAIHASGNKMGALVISYTGESTLITDVAISGSNSKQQSQAWAGLKVRAIVTEQPIVDTIIPSPSYVAVPSDAGGGGVTLNYRFVQLTGGLNISSNLTALPAQFIDTYELTKSANGFNWYFNVPATNNYYVTIQYAFSAGQLNVYKGSSYTPSDAGVIVGNRSCIVELDNAN